MPLRLGPSTKSKRRSSWKRKSADVKIQQKCHGFDIVPNTPLSSGQDFLDDRQWSLDLEISAEDEPVTRNMVLDSTETIQDALESPSAVVRPTSLNTQGTASSIANSTPDLHEVSSANLLSHGNHEVLPSSQNTFPAGPEIVFSQDLSIWHPPLLSTSADPSSRPPPPPPLPPVERARYRCTRCENVFKIQKELARRRTGLLTARTHLENEQGLLTGLRDYEYKSRELVIKAVATAVERKSLSDDLAEITGLQSRSVTANSDLKDGEARFRKAQGQLSSTEYHFGKKEAELYGLLSQSHMHLESLESDALGSVLHRTESVTEPGSESLPSLLEDYYDKAGDANLAWDRLQELETEHQIELRLRERAVEERLPVLLPEAQFVRGFIEERARIVRDLLQAKTDARDLRRQCEEYDYSIKDNGSNQALGAYDFDLWGNGSDRLLHLLLVGEVDQGERVQQWIKGNVHVPTLTRHPLWECRRAYSETGPPIMQSQYDAGYEAKTGIEVSDASEAPSMEIDVTENPQTPEIAASTTRASAWRPEVSLQRRYSSPEIRQFMSELSILKLGKLGEPGIWAE